MIECKQYIVLAGLYYHPRNWGEQYSHDFDTIDEAMSWAHTLVEGYKFYYDWFEIIDLQTKCIVFSSNPDWSNKQPKPRMKVRNEIK